MRHGNLFVISGPSGAGKGTLVARLLREIPDAWVSMSVTTRKPREGEVDGVHYRFASPEEFQELVDEDGLLEWATYGAFAAAEQRRRRPSPRGWRRRGWSFPVKWSMIYGW